MKVKISKKTKKLLYLACGVLVVAFIFFNSLQDAGKSSGASDFVAKMLSAAFGEGVRTKTHLIRKLAHLTEYALLGAVLAFVKDRINHKNFTTVTVVLSGLLCALCDETIQLFIDGRSGQISDIWIDFCGFLIGLSVYFLIKLIKSNKIKK